jgi:hypothetical protein
MSQAKRDTAACMGSRGNALSRGPMPRFCAAQDVGTRPLPCTVSFCHSHAAGELIYLSVHLSLRFGSPVDLPVDSPVIAGCWKLIRLSAHLSFRLSWPFTQLGRSDANKHTSKAGYFHAAGVLIRLSVHLSLHFGSPVDLPVIVGCMKLVRLSYHLSCHDLQDYRWRFALSAQLKSRQPKSAPDSRHPGIGVAL